MNRNQFKALIMQIEQKTKNYIVLDRDKATVLIKGKKSYALHSMNYKTRQYEWEIVDENRAKYLCNAHWFGHLFESMKQGVLNA